MASRPFVSREKYWAHHIISRLVRLTILILLTMILTERFSAAEETTSPTTADDTSEAYSAETERYTTASDINYSLGKTTPIVGSVTTTDNVISASSKYTERIDDVIEGTTRILYTVLEIKFDVSNSNFSQFEESIEKAELISEFTILLKSRGFTSVFSVLSSGNGGVEVRIALESTEHPIGATERDDVVTTIFEKVVLNGTVGELLLQNLRVKAWDKYTLVQDACDIRPCLWPEMKCVARKANCTAVCEDNKAYCLNGSICQPNNNYVKCLCKDDFFGHRCDKKPERLGSTRDENAYIGIVAAASVAVLLLVIMVVGCGYNRLINKGKHSDTYRSKLFPVENSVALEMLDEPPYVVGGVACQTIESFLLSKYLSHGVPPRPGFQHETVQTNESFLLKKAERQRGAFLVNASTDNDPNSLNTLKLSPSVLASTTSNIQDGKVCREDSEGLVTAKCSSIDAPGISNEAFLGDEGEIVPTSELEGKDSK